MSDPKPDRILAEESDNPWVKLILWAHEHPLDPTYRWNGFMKYLAEEKLSTLEPLYLTAEQRLILMQDWGVDSEQFERASSLSGDELEHAKNLFPNGIDLRKGLPEITIDNHIFSNELSFNYAFFANKISFENCRFEGSVEFRSASFKREATFSDSIFFENANFGYVQFHAVAEFKRVTFCGEVTFYCQQTDDNFAATFSNVILKTMTPVFHGRNCHPVCDFHGVTWPEIPKQDDAIQTHNTIETALKNLKISSESLGEKSKTWEDVAELLRQTLKSLEEILIICGSALQPLEKVVKAIKDALKAPDKVVLGHLEDASKCLEDILKNPLSVLLYHINCYEYIRTQAENIGQLELRKEMIRRELACRAELAEPSFERLLRCFVSGVSPVPPGEDGPRRRRRSRPGMCFTTPAGECCRLLVAMPMLRSTPSKPYAPRRMCCIFSAPWPRSSARSFCFSWPWRSGSNSACRSDAIRRRFDPWHFPPSPRRI